MKELDPLSQTGVPLIRMLLRPSGKLIHRPELHRAHTLHFPHIKCMDQREWEHYTSTSSMKVKPTALIHGGGHERGYRSGTLNVPGIVGLGLRPALRVNRITDADQDRIRPYRDLFEKENSSALEEVWINGHVGERLHTVSNLRVRFVDSQAVMSRFRSDLAGHIIWVCLQFCKSGAVPRPAGHGFVSC